MKKKTNSSQESNLLQRKWMLVSLDTISKDTLIKHKVAIDLTKKPNSGNGYAGCNQIMFNYSTDNKSEIIFSNIVTTYMYCEDTQKLESLFLKSLENTHKYSLDGHFLTLITKSNDTIKCVAEDWD